MKRIVWASMVAGAIVCFGVADAAAQPPARAPRQQMHGRMQQRVQQQFKRLDQNNNGAIDRAEWRRNERLFNRFDANHDGVLNPAEYQRFVRAAGAGRHTRRHRP